MGRLKGEGHAKIYGRDHTEVHPQKKKEVLYLVKKLREIGEPSDQLSESELISYLDLPRPREKQSEIWVWD